MAAPLFFLRCEAIKIATVVNRYWYARPRLTAILSGLLLTLAFSPYDWTVAAPLAIAVLASLLYNRSSNQLPLKQDILRTAGLCYLFGLSHFLTSLYWVAHPLLLDPNFTWVLPFSISLIPGISAIFTAILGALSALSRRLFAGIPALLPLVFAVSWVTTEWLRGYAILPFPWLLLGYSTAGCLPLMQFAAVGGVHSLSFILALSGSTIYFLISDFCKKSKSRDRAGSTTLICYLAYLTAIAAIYVWGEFRASEPQPLEADCIRIHLVQPNIPQYPYTYHDKVIKLRETLSFIRSNVLPFDGSSSASLLVLPESAFPFTIPTDINQIEDVASLQLHPNTFVLLGADSYDEVSSASYNSMFLVDNAGTILRRYDKRILAPFGEYIPWFPLVRYFLPGTLTGGPGFTPGEYTTGSLSIPFTSTTHNDARNAVTFITYICYEIAFGQQSLPFTATSELSPSFALNITNDSWLGDTAGPYQHLAIARIRAIELGLPLVRVANTGVSAFIDKYGRVVKQIPLNSSGVVTVSIPVGA